MPVYERLGVKRNVREISPGKLGLIARDRLGDAVCLVVKDECEQVVASFAAAVAFTMTKSQVAMLPTTRSSCQLEMSMPLSPTVGTALRDDDALVASAECRHDGRKDRHHERHD